MEKQQVTYEVPQIVVQENMRDQRPGLHEKAHRIARHTEIVQHRGIGRIRISHCKTTQNEKQEFCENKHGKVDHDKFRGHIAGSHGIFQIVPDGIKHDRRILS